MTLCNSLGGGVCLVERSRFVCFMNGDVSRVFVFDDGAVWRVVLRGWL
jgi:hypothetical protein